MIIENIKGFRSLDLSFGDNEGELPGWYVITGPNGSGKTVFLKSVAMALLGPEIIRALQPDLKGWVQYGSDRAEVAVQIQSGEEDQFKAGRRYKYPFWSEVALSQAGKQDVELAPSSRRRGNKRGPLNGPWAAGTHGWFCAGYGPYRRLYGASPSAQRLMSGPERVARFATLFKEDATLEECEHWLKDLNYKKLEQKEAEADLLGDVIRLLDDDFLRHGAKVSSVDSSGLWLKDEAGTLLHLSDMSEGYRSALAMMIDIVRQLSMVYPGRLVVEGEGGSLTVPHSGVVLVDEIDAHLHPEWQRDIGFWLTRRFPNVQFIVTTHSPLVAQAANPGAIFHFPPSNSDEVPRRLSKQDHDKILASKADVVLLSPAFGLEHTRSPEAVRRRILFARLSSKKSTVGLTPEEKRQWEQLEIFVHQDPDVDTGTEQIAKD